MSVTPPPLPDPASDYYCSDLARLAGESPVGTAPRADVWFLLEYTGPWQKKAFEQSDLSASLKERLAAFFGATPESRLLLIRQPTPFSSVPGSRTLYVAFAREQTPILYRFSVAAYEDILVLDLEAMRRGERAYQPFAIEEPLFLVCTNSKRDRCCARSGLPVYDALARTVGPAAWQCTHIGGHRFAANVLCFPHGVAYGCVGVEDVSALVDTYRQGRVAPDHLRGRSCYEREVQAADAFLRAETGLTGLEAFRLVSVQHGEDNRWTVEFETAVDGARHRVHGQTDPAALVNYLSCGESEPSPIAQHRLIRYEVVVVTP